MIASTRGRRTPVGALGAMSVIGASMALGEYSGSREGTAKEEYGEDV